jgi:homoserine acetyltransferase
VKPRLTDYSASGAAPILVIGTTGDPATPYADAVSLAERVLASGRLLTYRAEGHTAFGRANSCVDKIVEDFFLSETLPEGELTC